jgi:hypothetical protein
MENVLDLPTLKRTTPLPSTAVQREDLLCKRGGSSLGGWITDTYFIRHRRDLIRVVRVISWIVLLVLDDNYPRNHTTNTKQNNH